MFSSTTNQRKKSFYRKFVYVLNDKAKRQDEYYLKD